MKRTLWLSLMVGLLMVFEGCVSVKPDFESVTSTLNTPKLISNYQLRHFSYAQRWEGFGCGVDISESSKPCSPDYIFNTKKGNCAAYARFALYCLKKAGYESWIVKVWIKPATEGRYSGSHAVDYHYVTVFKYKDQNMWGVLDNGRWRETSDPNLIPDHRGQPFKIINIESD